MLFFKKATAVGTPRSSWSWRLLGDAPSTPGRDRLASGGGSNPTGELGEDRDGDSEQAVLGGTRLALLTCWVRRANDTFRVEIGRGLFEVSFVELVDLPVSQRLEVDARGELVCHGIDSMDERDEEPLGRRVECVGSVRSDVEVEDCLGDGCCSVQRSRLLAEAQRHRGSSPKAKNIGTER